MKEVTLLLDQAGRYRLPVTADMVVVKKFDGTPTKTYLELGSVYPLAWMLDRMTRASSPRPTSEWYIRVVDNQPGCIVTFLTGGPELANVQLVDEVASVKAHGLANGNIAVGTTAVQGPSIAAAPGQAVLVYADPANTDTIYIGSSSAVTTVTGFPIGAGNAMSLNVDNLSDLWFISGAAAQAVRYVVETVQRG